MNVRFATIVVLLIFSGNTGAQTALEIRTFLSDFQYREFDRDGEVLNTEEGGLPGFLFGVSRQEGDWRLQLAMSYMAGRVDYQGYSQLGQALSSETEERFLHGQVSVAREVVTARVAAYVALQENRWRRHILASAMSRDLRERYRWREFEIGVLFTPYRNEAWLLTWQLGVSRSFGASLEVDLASLGLNEVHLPMSGDTGWLSSLSLFHRLSESLSLGIAIGHRATNFKRGSEKTVSNGFQQYRLSEPRSKTRQNQISVALSKSF